jgi:hypothetical protein
VVAELLLEVGLGHRRGDHVLEDEDALPGDVDGDRVVDPQQAVLLGADDGVLLVGHVDELVAHRPADRPHQVGEEDHRAAEQRDQQRVLVPQLFAELAAEGADAVAHGLGIEEGFDRG